MGERVGASIQFGGLLKEEHVDKLIQLIGNYDLTADFDGSEPTRDNLGETFGNWEVNYGNLDDLVHFARKHQLYYKYWCDSGCEWDAETVIYRGPTNEEVRLACGHEGEFLTKAELKRLGSYEAALAYFEQFERSIPPLEIVP